MCNFPIMKIDSGGIVLVRIVTCVSLRKVSNDSNNLRYRSISLRLKCLCGLLLFYWA